MFIRFVSGEVHEDSHVATGLFCAISQLGETVWVPRYELELLRELVDWFEHHLESPLKHLKSKYCYERPVCWFKPTAREHVTRAWQIVAILERNDILIWKIKSTEPGHIYYEDDAQVFAIPYAHRMRRCEQWQTRIYLSH